MRYFLLFTLLSAAPVCSADDATLPHSSFSIASAIPAQTESSEAEKASDRYHIAEMARINGASYGQREAPFVDYVITPIGIILFAIVLLRQLFSFD